MVLFLSADALLKYMGKSKLINCCFTCSYLLSICLKYTFKNRVVFCICTVKLHILIPGENMKKKVYVLFGFLVVMLGLACYSMLHVSRQSAYVDAAGRQSIYKLTVGTSRGNIYDANMNLLVGSTKKTVAAVIPTIENISVLNTVLGEEKRSLLGSALENGKPFVVELEENIEQDGIDVFEVPVRYSAGQLAVHVIGYLDSEGNGATGVEKAMNDVLQQSRGEISVHYSVDAMGRAITGADREIRNTVADSNGGVVLTLDQNIQQAAEEAAKKLGTGAVIVTEVPNCEIRALVSVPDYDLDNIEAAAKSADSPMMNRAFSAYSPGSVFKLVDAAVSIGEGFETDEYECTGSIEVDGLTFNCISSTAHGKMNLHTALQNSCNCYFINAVQKTGSQPVLTMAYNMGFGAATEFGRGLYSNAGNLPELKDLDNARALANFSFGQGSLTVTPLQVAGMLNTIATGGEYTQPKLISGTVDDSLKFFPVSSEILNEKTRVMESSTAALIRGYMESAVNYGTGKSGKAEGVKTGAKTGTAQTGIYIEEDELNHFWYAGYICDAEGPRYCITVLCESVVSDDGAAAKTFQEISKYIASEIMG